MKLQPSLRPGGNRTGMASAEDELRRGMLATPRELTPTSRGNAEQIAHVRVRYAREGFPVGTMPPIPRADAELIPLFDLLGARLQFERMGVRLYDALIAKLAAYGGFHGGPEPHELEHIRDEELAHARLLDGLISDLGGDPTALTPCANLQSIATRGIGDVLLDPRTSLLECLDAILFAELADHEEWLSLIELARELSRDSMVHIFQSAQLTEEDHLAKVRRWLWKGRGALSMGSSRHGEGPAAPPRS